MPSMKEWFERRRSELQRADQERRQQDIERAKRQKLAEREAARLLEARKKQVSDLRFLPIFQRFYEYVTELYGHGPLPPGVKPIRPRDLNWNVTNDYASLHIIAGAKWINCGDDERPYRQRLVHAYAVPIIVDFRQQTMAVAGETKPLEAWTARGIEVALIDAVSRQSPS